MVSVPAPKAWRQARAAEHCPCSTQKELIVRVRVRRLQQAEVQLVRSGPVLELRSEAVPRV